MNAISKEVLYASVRTYDLVIPSLSNSFQRTYLDLNEGLLNTANWH